MKTRFPLPDLSQESLLCYSTTFSNLLSHTHTDHIVTSYTLPYFFSLSTEDNYWHPGESCTFLIPSLKLFDMSANQQIVICTVSVCGTPSTICRDNMVKIWNSILWQWRVHSPHNTMFLLLIILTCPISTMISLIPITWNIEDPERSSRKRKCECPPPPGDPTDCAGIVGDLQVSYLHMTDVCGVGPLKRSFIAGGISDLQDL